MKVFRKIIEIDEELCDGCGLCVPSCAEGALEIVDGKARISADNLCDGLGACLGDCPNGALRVIEREADDFDEEAVEAHLAQKTKEEQKGDEVMSCGCPSANIQTFVPVDASQTAGMSAAMDGEGESTLSHWPVQIKLVPANAPFLKGADLLVVADCVPISYSSFHRDFIKGKAVMMGCPKFDDVQEYIDKFADIFKTADIKSITTVVVEVPCCSGLPMIVKKGLEISGQKIPMEVVVISTRGKVLERAIG